MAGVVVVAACASPASAPGVARPDSTVTQATAVPRSPGSSEVILATTTSTQDTGLCDVLVPLFEQESGFRMKTVSVGTGAALALGARGEADVVLVHAPQAEKQWMDQGNGTERILVMHNDFVVVGPDDDPAVIRGLPAAGDALARISATSQQFISRGDNSGTHQVELALWRQAGVTPTGGSWYMESGTGMGQTLAIANQKRAYTIADRATWLAQRNHLQLRIVVDGDPALLNVYHAMPVNPAKFAGLVNGLGGKAFADFLVAARTQEIISAFGHQEYGEALFVGDAGKSEQDLGL
jgi:tungstate transport system substrate-binding protein